MPTYIQKPSAQLSEPLEARSDSAVKAEGALELGIVLDQSASMSGLVNETMAAFNALVDEQRATSEGTALSLALFNHSIKLLYDGLSIGEVEPLSGELCKPSGGTALNDAIGAMIQAIGKRTRRGTRVLIAILTDGAENASQRFSKADILQMITYRRTTYDWQFIFIGPPEALDYALSIGIPISNVVSFSADSAGITAIMARLSKSMKAYQLGDRRYALKLRN
jgi:hypothetical protein